MPFVRVSRDRHGYEHFYLVDSTMRRGKPSRPRVLYWFRTPPGVLVGREPFDESVRRALEARYPDVAFDWDKLRRAAVPPPEVEPWRERRRIERAAKQARQGGEREESGAAPPMTSTAEPQSDSDVPGVPGSEGDVPGPESSQFAEALAQMTGPDSAPAALDIQRGDEEPNLLIVDVVELPAAEPSPDSSSTQAGPAETISPPREPAERRRRRRRGGRRRNRSFGREAASANTLSDQPKADPPNNTAPDPPKSAPLVPPTKDETPD